MGDGGGCCIGKMPCLNCCVAKFLKDLFKPKSKGGSYENYDRDKADLQLTLKVQAALTDFQSETRRRSEQVENEVIKESRESLDNFIDELKKYNRITYGSRRLDINITSIEREQRKTEDQIHGFIAKKVAKRASLDDEECLEILKLDPGSEKSKKLDDFYRKVLKEAVSELTNILRETMEKQTDIIEDKIQQRIESIVSICEAKSDDFDKIQKIKTKDETKIEEEQLRLSHFVALNEYGLSILE